MWVSELGPDFYFVQFHVNLYAEVEIKDKDNNSRKLVQFRMHVLLISYTFNSD